LNHFFKRTTGFSFTQVVDLLSWTSSSQKKKQLAESLGDLWFGCIVEESVDFVLPKAAPVDTDDNSQSETNGAGIFNERRIASDQVSTIGLVEFPLILHLI
jgi:hypothetical protein